MTDERDFDRLARAWLELGPDEAPDRAVAAVLQAAETTPQVRRPLRWPTWRSYNMNRISQAAGLVAVLVVAIGGGIILSQRDRPAAGGPVTSPSAAPSHSVAPSQSVAPSPSVAPSGSAPAGSGAALVLQRAPANLGCDAIGIEYDIATIHIDPNAATDVWAETGTGHRLAMYWSDGFSANDGEPPVIRDPEGREIARDGTVIDIKHWQSYGPWNRYFLCPGPDTLHVLETAPQ